VTPDLSPEEKARVLIDEQLRSAGWSVQALSEISSIVEALEKPE